MKICPSCHEEFFEHIEHCGICKVDLITPSEASALRTKNKLLSKEEMLKEETICILEAGLHQCRDLEKVLSNAKISALLYPRNLHEQEAPTNLGATSDPKYLVLIRLQDVELAKKALEGRFSEQVAKEGQGHYADSAINLEDEVITCPACGEKTNTLHEGECPTCGLFLDAIPS